MKAFGFVSYQLLVVAIAMAFGWFANETYYSFMPLKSIASPSDWVNSGNLYYDGNLTCFDFGDAYWVTIEDTHSMEPTISSKSNVIKKTVNPELIKVGDIISFKRLINGTNTLVLHRVIEIQGKQFITKGDNVRWPDEEPVDYSQVTGVVEAIIY